ncbi:MAG: nitroreductase/quinone reductase family protein [Novosphingobium sp.]
MSDESSAAISATRRDWVGEHREIYLRSGGVEGHIQDITVVGGHRLGTHCLIKVVGRKSGKVLITPLCYGAIGGEIAVVGSKGGADQHPAWYLNIREMETIDVQVATQAFRCTWREPEGEERRKVWDFMVDGYPFYAAYQAATDREIAIVLFAPGEEIPVFNEEDATGMRQY